MTNTQTPYDVLVVDLDGTLLRSDMLYESFWAALGQNWKTPLHAALALQKGRAEMKQCLSNMSDVDVTLLPYDAEVIAYITQQRAKGIHTALVTATDQSLADRIGAHLGIFDEVHGSDGTTNLKGDAKASFLKDTFSGKTFAYMGDSTADIPVWQASDYAIAVNVSATLRETVGRLETPSELMTTVEASAKPYIKALRPHQWMKNILVFLPMLTAHQLTGAAFLTSLVAFIAFSLIASSVYVLNDLLDLRADRLHPRKCKRPFAAGAVPIADGTRMAGGLLLLGICMSLFVGGLFTLTMLAYFLMTLAYSLNLKRRVIVDICVLAALYTMRIIAGGIATGITLSVWLLAFSIFFFFAMAAIKRQAELVDMAKRGELDVSSRGYSVKDLEIISTMALGAGYVSILVLALYINSPTVIELYATPTMLWAICFVLLYWISRVVMITHRGHMDDDPVVFATRDKNSGVCALIIVVCLLAGAFL